MGTCHDGFLEENEYPKVATSVSTTIPKIRTVRDCSCGAEMEQYWNIEKFAWEWYCEECGLSLEI